MGDNKSKSDGNSFSLPLDICRKPLGDTNLESTHLGGISIPNIHLIEDREERRGPTTEGNDSGVRIMKQRKKQKVVVRKGKPGWHTNMKDK